MEDDKKVELVMAEDMDSQIQIIEKTHQQQIIEIHENMDKLVNDCLTIEVKEDDKASYDRAVELKRVVKQTHISIEKKRKELKQPLIDYGKRLDKFVATIYAPLVNAEKIVKKKMEVYEKRQEKIKAEKKLQEEQENLKKKQIEDSLLYLQSKLGEINSAKSKEELDSINDYLNSVDVESFGDKSGEAGFILTQLKMTCNMAYKVVETIVKEENNQATDQVTDQVTDQIPTKHPTSTPQVSEEPKSGSETKVRGFRFPSPDKTVVNKEEPSLFSTSEEPQIPAEEPPHEIMENKDGGTDGAENKSVTESPIDFTDEEMIGFIQEVSDKCVNDVSDFIAKQFALFMQMKFGKLNKLNEQHYKFMETETIKRTGSLLRIMN